MLRNIARLAASAPKRTSFVPARSFAGASSLNLKPPVRVAVTGAAGQIGYATVFRIASGEMLGKDQPVILQLLELPQAEGALKGVVMELEDCAFPLLRGIVPTTDEKKAFEGADYALLIGARPRGKGMERADLLQANGKIFKSQGQALNAVANRDTLRVIVVGNPANTNCLIASHFAPNIDPKRFTAMTQLDHNRGLAQLALKSGTTVSDVEKFAIWGNHSASQYPDITNTTIKGKAAKDVLNDQKWVTDTFIPVVQKRGAAIIEARNASSAASAGSAAIEHMRYWTHGTNGQWTSMAVLSDGSYGADKGLYFSFPVVCENGNYKIVQGLKLDEFSKQRFEKTRLELLEEKSQVQAVLNEK